MSMAEGGGRTLVVGADWSTESQRGIEWATALAAPDDRIVLVHAWQMPVVAGYDMVLAVDPTELSGSAGQALNQLVAEIADPRIVPVVRQGHAGRELVAEADDQDAAMIVLGHSGNSRVAMMLGSTANYVLHHTTRPVVVVRGWVMDDEAEVLPPRLVVVGVDDHDLDSDDAESRREPVGPGRAVGHTGCQGSSVFGSCTPGSCPRWRSACTPRSRPRRTRWTPPPKPRSTACWRRPDRLQRGSSSSSEPVRGTPGFAMIEESRDADLVVLGSRGHGGFSELLLGSTTSEVAAHSHCPVAVVR